MSDFNKRLEQTKELLGKSGNSLCLAKWTQTTIHLGLGHTHSCHHPRTHVIPLDEIKKNSGALHNTEYKKLIRKEMLENIRPKECDYCWKVEDLKDDALISDRFIKSSDEWSLPYYAEIIKAGYQTDFDPTYLEVSFSHVCNFKCSYCMPSISSQWMEEIEKYGAYPTSMKYNNLDWVKLQKKMPIPVRDNNPYIDAFWDWFPKIYKKLHTFRITGGEPLLDKNLFKVLDYIIENPNSNLELSINSNFCVPETLFFKFLEKIKFITSNKLVKKISVYTSAEAHSKHAEYIRHGLDYTQWKKNCHTFINEITPVDLTIMSTYNLLSIISFKEFLKDVYLMKLKAFGKSTAKSYSKVYIDIPYLNNPHHQIVGLLTKDFMSYIDEQLIYMEQNKNILGNVPGFRDVEIQKLERVKAVFTNFLENPMSNLSTNRKDFSIFVDEHDRRRGTNFLETFPELQDFYYLCKRQ
jgi:organic radical activating enzyme